MEIKAKRDDLLATLYWTQSIVERRDTMPILGNVLIEAQKGSVRFTAKDLEVGVRGSVDAEVAKKARHRQRKKNLRDNPRSSQRAGAAKTIGQ